MILLPFILCTKCAEKSINITIVNERDSDYVLYRESSNVPAKDMITNEQGFVPAHIIALKDETVSDSSFNEYDLDFYTKDRKYYTFYFYKATPITMSDGFNYKISKTYDSIMVSRNDLQFGTRGSNVFLLKNGAVYFKN